MPSRSFAFATLLLLVSASFAEAASFGFYLGDDAALGLSMVDRGTPDGANAGNVTYAFPNAAASFTVGSAAMRLTEVNFWSDSTSGTVTPFVATYNGLGIADRLNYSILLEGDPIAVTSTGVNNHAFTVSGAAPTIALPPGTQLIAGFHQSLGVIPFSGTGTADYLNINGDVVPATFPNPFTQNATHSALTRTYAFNVGGGQLIPEPSTALLLGLG
ncbi:MAG: hypothetical protein KDA42_10290, partial [Planctomycetales bacterium]|nr:hypothetical protein [Planctomycetales bacterium]